MRILITGKNSYIGNAFKQWIAVKEPTFIVEEISLRNINLDDIKFNNYDVVFHVAGIAHISSNKKLIPEYFKINRDLAIAVANKAKEAGVKQYIFTSSMAIYGPDLPIGDFRPIDTNHFKPNSAYGQSKLEADLEIQKLHSNIFKTSILRLPMVYGLGSKGNFPKLEKLAMKLPFFPKVKNMRSVININSLSEIVRIIIRNQLNGIFYPQDSIYFDSTEFIKAYRTYYKKKTILIPFLSLFILLMSKFIQPLKKIYGNKYYDQKMSQYKNIDYQIENWKTYIQKL